MCERRGDLVGPPALKFVVLGHAGPGNYEAAQNEFLAFPSVQGLRKYPEHKQGVVTNVFVHQVFPLEALGIEAHITLYEHLCDIFEPPSGGISDFIEIIGADELAEDLLLQVIENRGSFNAGHLESEIE